MSPSSPQHEPTMEEILASIRKIISEDSTEAQPAQTPPAAPANAVPAPQDADVLELTQEIHEAHEEPPPAPPPPPAPVVVAAPPPEQPEPAAHDAADDVVFQPIEETPVSSPAQAPVSSSEGLFSDKTRKALNDAFTNVEPEPEIRPAPGPAATIAPVDGRTLEAVFDHAVRETFDPVLQNWLDQNKDSVVERMKPVITQWLDEHFPALLEEAVRDELARAAKARVRR
jgi:cell pole-organizing protein PopZ